MFMFKLSLTPIFEKNQTLSSPLTVKGDGIFTITFTSEASASPMFFRVKVTLLGPGKIVLGFMMAEKRTSPLAGTETVTTAVTPV